MTAARSRIKFAMGADVQLFEQAPVLRPVGAGAMLQPLGH